MKKILIFLLFAGPLAHAQYHPFPKYNAAWEEAFTGIIGVPLPTYTVLCGDTIIDNEVQSKVFNVLLDTLGQITEMQYSGALREDNNKMVWFTIPDGSTGLLYDFNLVVGDTFTAVPDIVDMVVESIGSTLVGGVPHRTITFEAIYGLPKETWVEGVGSSYGMLTRGIYAIDYSPFSKCFSIDGVELYNFNPDEFVCTFSFTEENCDVVNSVGDWPEKEPALKVFPNPFRDFFTMELENKGPTENWTVEAYNFFGVKVLEATPISSSESHSFENLDWASGTYFLVLRNESGVVLNREVIVK